MTVIFSNWVTSALLIFHRGFSVKGYQCCHCGGGGLDSYGETCQHCEGYGTC